MMLTMLLTASLGATWTLSVQRSDSAPSCPDQPRLRRAIAERLGRDPFLDAEQPRAEDHRALSVQFTREATRHLATIALVDAQGRPTGTRELSSTASDCAELAGAVVLAATIAIDPLVLTRPSTVADAGARDEWSLPALTRPPDAARPPPVRPRELPIEPPPSESTPPPPLEALPGPNSTPIFPPPRPIPLLGPPPPEPVKPGPTPPPALNAVFVGLGGGVSVGQVPNVAALGTLQASWGTRSTLLTVSADLTSPGAVTVGAGGIRALLVGGALDGCAKWSWFGACGVFGLGSWQVWSVGLPNPRPQGALFVSAGLGLVLDVPAGELVKVRVGAKGWYQPRMVVDVGGIPVWAGSSVAFTATVTAHFKVWGDRLP